MLGLVGGHVLLDERRRALAAPSLQLQQRGVCELVQVEPTLLGKVDLVAAVRLRRQVRGRVRVRVRARARARARAGARARIWPVASERRAPSV